MKLFSIRTLLSEPREVVDHCHSATDIRGIALSSLLSIAFGAAVFGGVIGAFRGGGQIAFSALKTPLSLLLTLVLCGPAFYAFAHAGGNPARMRAAAAILLAAAGRAALVLLAFAPVLWLMIDLGAGYHLTALLAAAAYGLAGLSGLGIAHRGFGPGVRAHLASLAFVGVFLAVSGQAAWVMRPYLVRPQTAEVPFLRSTEGSFGEALMQSGASAAGYYPRDTYDDECVEPSDCASMIERRGNRR